MSIGRPVLALAASVFALLGGSAAAQNDRRFTMSYWYEFARGGAGAVTWTRHTIDFGGKAGSGLQLTARDMDGDGDVDVVSAGKSGLFLAENLRLRSSPRGAHAPARRVRP